MSHASINFGLKCYSTEILCGEWSGKRPFRLYNQKVPREPLKMPSYYQYKVPTPKGHVHLFKKSMIF